MIGYKLSALLLVLTVLAGTPAQAQDAALAAGSSWTNELGSTLTIDSVSADGTISGSYVSAVGCDAGTSFPMNGTVQGVAITFDVNWGANCGSVTSWTGAYDADMNAIRTLWYLAQNTSEWSGILAGANNFRPASD